ncbi:hypothetical protein JHK84_043058 [Glycine max]|nr:hypothetical protein JHK84_043058 [Glycine max]
MALDQYEPLLEKERVVTEDFEAVSKQEREKRHRFNEVKHKRQRRRITDIISDIMCKRKEHFTMERYLLGHLLNYNDEKGQMLSDDQIAECNWGPI